MAITSSRLTSAPALAGALIVVTVLAAGPLQPLDAALQGYHARKYTPNWADFLDSVPNAVAGQAVCLPVLLAVAIVIAWRRRTWHPLAIVAATEVAFFGGIGGLKVLLGRTVPAAGEGFFWKGGAIEHGWYGIAYPSGHAAEAVLIYGAAAYLLRTYAGPDMRIRRRLNWMVVMITANAIVVAFYLGYHWPTDLIGGLIAGGLMLRIIVDVDRAVAARRPILGRRRMPARGGIPAPAPAPALARTAQPVAASAHPMAATSVHPVATPSAHPALVRTRRDVLPNQQPAAGVTDPACSPWDRAPSPALAVGHRPARTRVRTRELVTSVRG